MATDLTSSNFSSFLKTRYEDYFAEILFANSPLIGMLPKKKVGGQTITQAVSFEGPQNISADFATAVAGTSDLVNAQFIIPYRELFQKFSLNDKEISASKSAGANAFLENIVFKTKMALQTMSKNLGQQLYRDNNGSRGQIGSVASNVITLSERADIVQFSIGQQLIASANADGSSPRDSGTAKSVTKIDPILGTVTLSAAITGMAANDYLFNKGDAGARADGILGWIPDYATRSSGLGTFLNVDRSQDPASLAGLAVNSAGSFEDSLINSEAELRLFGSMPDVIMMNPLDWASFSQEISSKDRVEKKGTGAAVSISYSAIHIAGCNADIVVDSHVPRGKAFFLKTDSWYLGHMDNDVINDWDADSLRFLRNDSSNTIDGRMKSYYNLVCVAPKENLVLTLPSS